VHERRRQSDSANAATPEAGRRGVRRAGGHHRAGEGFALTTEEQAEAAAQLGAYL